MEKFYSLEPEVAGELGQKTKLDSTVHPPLAQKLHFTFTGWLGDELLECFPCYIVTEALMLEINKIQPSPTGYLLDDVVIEISEQFKDIYPNKTLPPFKWLKVTGEAGKDDFGISSNNLLIVSERILNILKTFQINECEVDEWK